MTPEGGLADSPTERRVQVLAFLALVGAVAVDAALTGFGPFTLLGLPVPGVVTLACLALGLVLGIAAVARRSLVLVAAAVVALVVPALAERPWDVTPVRYAGSVAFGFLALMYAELVHMTIRYEKWHRVVDEARADTTGLDHATQEYLGTFFKVFGLSALIALVVGVLYFTLTAIGPAQHRAALDYRSLYGLVGAAVLVFGTILVVSLGRGADWSKPNFQTQEETGPDPEASTIGSPEMDSHAYD